jgi:membrane fusion protein (multidrug efflux system)
MFEVERTDRSQERHEPFAAPKAGEGRGPLPEDVVSLGTGRGISPSARPSPGREPPDTAPLKPEPGGPRPVEPAQPPSPSSSTKTRSARQRWTRGLLFALLPLVLIGGGYWYVTGGQVMSTDDAYVEADKVGISTDVSGIVKEVDVSENEHVNAGQVLYRLDPRQFQIALDSAKANLAQTALMIDSMKQDYQRMLSDVDAEQAKVNLAQVTYDRYAALVRTDSISKANYDQARFTLDADKNTLQSLSQQAQVQLAKLVGNPNIPVTQHPQYLQAKAQVDEAQRQLDDTVVKAPFNGVVTNVPSIAPGKYLSASTTAFYLVATDHVWVDANPKETELTYVQPGQPVTVTVDTYPGREWRGTVASISPAAASVEVDVDTGHARGLPHFLAALFGQTEKGA